jgi:hypothetical protein
MVIDGEWAQPEKVPGMDEDSEGDEWMLDFKKWRKRNGRKTFDRLEKAAASTAAVTPRADYRTDSTTLEIWDDARFDSKQNPNEKDVDEKAGEETHERSPSIQPPKRSRPGKRAKLSENSYIGLPNDDVPRCCHRCRNKMTALKMKCRNIRADGSLCTTAWCQYCVEVW